MSAFCCRCQEDFPVCTSRLADRFREWRGHEGHFLCGNCYFDLLDAEDDD